MASTSHSNMAKCPCCNNPWARATEGFFTENEMCMTCGTTASNNTKNMDLSVSPHDNFYLYANGGWIKDNPIPPGYPSWNTFTCLFVESQENLKKLLEELNTKKETLNDNEKKLKLLYQFAMDEELLEQQQLTPLQPLLKHIQELATQPNKNKLARGLGELFYKHGLSVFVKLGASPDNSDSKHSILQASQGGLGLPDRDYYFDEDKQDKRDKYKLHIAKMLQLTTIDESNKNDDEFFTEMANEIYNVERELAQAHMTKTECRDPQATYNKMENMAELQEQLSPTESFDFEAFLMGATGGTLTRERVGPINVRNVQALKRVAVVVSKMESNILCYYLHWHIVHATAKYMFANLVQEDFLFNETILAGTQELKPRWKRAMQFVENSMGEALGQLYCSRHFDESKKQQALEIVQNVKEALKERLQTVPWMTADSTRQAALEKMKNFRVKIGYPDSWLDYTNLVLHQFDSLVQMVLEADAFEVQRMIREEVNQPTNSDKWFMTPQTVNAYYHPNLNEIVFPAAILQEPFYAPHDLARNYGAMGAVVGHEMTHGFDDKGRKFDSHGNMVDWWTSEDGEEYDKRVQVMVEQANEFKVQGQAVQGELTCGENIADLGGLRLALRALLKKQQEIKDTDEKDFTPVQRFFLGWAQCWRQNITKERSLQLLTLDPHGPNEMRCNGPLSNMPEFHEAFQVPNDSPMYKQPEARVDIW